MRVILFVLVMPTIYLWALDLPIILVPLVQAAAFAALGKLTAKPHGEVS